VAQVNEVVALLRSRKQQVVDELVALIVSEVPRYAQSDRSALRDNCEQLVVVFVQILETDDPAPLMDLLEQLTSQRIGQGFAPADFIQALLMAYPVLRSVVRQAGPRNDAMFAQMFHVVEQAIFKLIATASSIFATGLKRESDAKVHSLTSEKEKLEQQEKHLLEQTKLQERELAESSHFARRVLESLSSGVAVTELGTPDRAGRVLMWSDRMAEITGVAPGQIVGQPADMLKKQLGVPVQEMLASIRINDRLPLSKVKFTTPRGDVRHALVRGERLRTLEGAPKGMVVTADDVTERELLIDSFSRYVSREVVQRLLARAGPWNKLEGERKMVSILFADIRGFTTLSEKISLEELHGLINEYFRVMIEQVSAFEGIIDKFIGDKIMAVFSQGGADGAVAAARSALAIQKAIAELNRQRSGAGAQAIDVGIGINTGEVVMGTVGSEERMSFTVIGDSVNVADRFQALAGAGEIYLGEGTVKRLGDRFEVEELGARSIRGRTQPESLYRLLSAKA